ncbi:MAG: hypothetical protein AAFU77_12890 [Myxococcota bacterium]
MRRMPFAEVDGFVVVMQGYELCPDSEFDEYIEFLNGLAKRSGEPLRILVRSHGASLTTMQRSRLNQLASRYGMSVVVVGTSGAVRILMTMFSWLQKMQTHGFDDSDMAGAMRYLKMPLTTQKRCEAKIAEFERTLPSTAVGTGP